MSAAQSPLPIDFHRRNKFAAIHLCACELIDMRRVTHQCTLPSCHEDDEHLCICGKRWARKKPAAREEER